MLSDAKRYRSLSRRGSASGTGIASYMGLGGGETRSQKRDLQSAFGKGEDAFIKEYLAQSGLEGDAATAVRGALGGKGGIYEKAKAGGKDMEVAISTALTALKSDPRMKDAIEKKEDSKRSPQERDIHAMAADIKTLASSMKPEAISGPIGTALQPAVDALTAAANKMG
jgi:hypothetical protein